MLVKVGVGLFTVKLPAKVAVPPPGAALVTETSRVPVAAPAAMVMLAVAKVVVATTTEFTVILAPKLAEVTPSIKLVPFKITARVCKRFPEVGTMLVKVGAGFCTAKVWAAEVPPPGTALVAVTLRLPVAASTATVIFMVIWVALSTVVEFTVMPAPEIATEETLLIKLVPVRTMSPVAKRLAVVGKMLVKVGAGFCTVKLPAKVAVPPPGAALVTETSRAPVAAPAAMVILAVIWVALSTVVVLTVILAPKFTLETPVWYPVPVKTTSSVCILFAVVGIMLVKVGAGLPASPTAN